MIYLFILSFLFFGHPLFAEEVCEFKESPINELQEDSCRIQCETYFAENPQARNGKQFGKDYCPTTSQIALTGLATITRTGFSAACLKGAGQGALKVVQEYSDSAESVYEQVMQRAEWNQKCTKDSNCMADLVRTMPPYDGRSSHGEFLYTDERIAQVLSSDLKNKNAAEIEALADAKNKKRIAQCAPSITAWVRSYGTDVDSARRDKKNFNNPCFDSYLEKMTKSPRAVSEIDIDALLKQLGISLRCYSPEEQKELICYAAAQMLFDPTNLLGPGAVGAMKLRQMARVLKKNGAAKKAVSAEKKSGGVPHEAQETKVASLASPSPEVAQKIQKSYSEVLGHLSENSEIVTIISALEKKGVSKEKIRSAIVGAKCVKP